MTASRDTIRKETDPLLEQVLDGRYRIVQQLGKGGMGLVYEAKHAVLGTRLALKILRSEVWGDEEALARLKREAQTASAIGHENIVDVRDFGQLMDGSTYVVMELIDGRDLLQTIRADGPLPWERARHVALQICAALGAAHEVGVVHRDLKPENILLTLKKGDPDFVKIVDFGIAMVEGGAKITRAGHVVGTPEYMAPEQCAGIDVDHRADVYALGVLLYEMVTGELPFQHPDVIQLVRMHMQEPPPPMAEHGVEVPEGYEAVVLRCLAKRPAKRFSSMAEVAAALRAIEEAPMQAPAPEDLREDAPMLTEPRPEARGPATTVVTGADEAQAPPKRSRAPMVVFALIAAIGGAAVGVLLIGPGGDGEPEASPISPVHRPSPEVEPEPPAAPEAPPEPAADVQMTIDSVPSGARVYEGDAFVGNTPFAMLRPGEGERVELTLRADGYAEETVAVGALSASELRVQLTRRRGATHPEAPRSDRPETQDTPPSGRSRSGQHQQFLDPWER